MVFIILLFLTGCWDYREIENLIIVAGLAVDIGTSHNYLVTIETVELKQSQGGNVQPQSKVIRIEGETPFDAIRNAIRISEHMHYWSHASVVILSEEVARKGILQILETVVRAKEPRLTMNVLVSKEKKASDILPQNTLLDKIYSFEITEMLKAQEQLSKAPSIEVYEVVNKILDSGISVAIPTIGLTRIEEQITPEISGLAMFKKDTLVGFLDGEEAKIFLFITDQIKGGTLVKSYSSESPTSNISISINESNTKIQPRYEKDKIIMKIKTNTKASINDWGISGNITVEKLIDVEKQFEESLRRDIENLIKKVQREYQCDIFGFGQALKNQNPQLWKKLEGNWEEIFANLEIEVDTTIDIKNTSLLSNTLKVGD